MVSSRDDHFGPSPYRESYVEIVVRITSRSGGAHRLVDRGLSGAVAHIRGQSSDQFCTLSYILNRLGILDGDIDLVIRHVERGQLMLILAVNHAKATTADLAEIARVANHDLPTLGVDQALTLKVFQTFCNARPPNAEQLRENPVG